MHESIFIFSSIFLLKGLSPAGQSSIIKIELITLKLKTLKLVARRKHATIILTEINGGKIFKTSAECV